MTEDEMERLVKLFEIFIEVDKRLKAEAKEKDLLTDLHTTDNK